LIKIHNSRRRAEVIEELFNGVIKENTGRAVHEEHPIVYEQIRNRWKRILENLPAANDMESRGSHSNNGGQASQNNNRGRGGGTIVRGRGGGRGAARGGFRPTLLVPQVHIKVFRALRKVAERTDGKNRSKSFRSGSVSKASSTRTRINLIYFITLIPDPDPHSIADPDPDPRKMNNP
jgi:hypothetical protein